MKGKEWRDEAKMTGEEEGHLGTGCNRGGLESRDEIGDRIKGTRMETSIWF